MAASTISLTALTDDTGTAAVPVGDGTILNNTWFQTTLCGAVNAMFAGAGAYATFTLGGKLAVEGFGTHTFSAGGAGGNILSVRNTTAGVANYSMLQAGNNASATHAYLQAFSSTYTTSGPSVQAGALLACEGAGGLSIAGSNAAGTIRFYTGGTTLRGQIDNNGQLQWSAGGTHTFIAAVNNLLYVQNSAAGVANYASVGAQANAGTAITLAAYSTTFTTSGSQVQNSGVLGCGLANGLQYDASSHTFWGGKMFLQTGYHLNIGAVAYPGRSVTNPTNAINIYADVAPAGTLAGGLTIYAKDVAGVKKLFYMDSAGTEVGPLT